MTQDKRLDKQLDKLGRAVVEREKTRVVQLPLWPEPKRGTPNSFIRSALFSAIQSKDREFIKGVTIASQQGIEIKFTGEQLNQEDLTLWETLVHLARQNPLGYSCSFTAHGILKAMRLNTGGDEHRRLHEGITRLIACAVEIRHSGQIYVGSLIEGSRSEEDTGHYSVRLNREIIKLYGETQWTAIDWEQRLEMRRKPLAQAIHAYYSSHREPFPIKLETLRDITGSRNSELRGFKRRVNEALNELVSIGFLQGFKIEGDLVRVNRARATLLSD